MKRPVNASALTTSSETTSRRSSKTNRTRLFSLRARSAQRRTKAQRASRTRPRLSRRRGRPPRTAGRLWRETRRRAKRRSRCASDWTSSMWTRCDRRLCDGTRATRKQAVCWAHHMRSISCSRPQSGRRETFRAFCGQRLRRASLSILRGCSHSMVESCRLGLRKLGVLFATRFRPKPGCCACANSRRQKSSGLCILNTHNIRALPRSQMSYSSCTRAQRKSRRARPCG
mmetsp:Transcript_15187/g.40762  ORF Transcript_15187/g.40762 Transcript_15187/m.40762 type:complete len:229 (+) Transcript_15187:153-839(+)